MSSPYDNEILVVNPAGKNFGYYCVNGIGYAMWDAVGNYPTLNATLPDNANTPWSIKALSRAPTMLRPFTVFAMSKVCGLTTGTRTITAELAINDLIPTPNKGDWWIELNYTDNAGIPRHETTRAIFSTAPLDTSTAAWTYLSGGKVVYAATNHTRYKIALTTSYQVAQNSEITATLKTVSQSGDDARFFFLDPDFGVA